MSRAFFPSLTALLMLTLAPVACDKSDGENNPPAASSPSANAAAPTVSYPATADGLRGRTTGRFRTVGSG